MFSLYLLNALCSTLATKKIFTSAFGNTVVPISRPSITIPPLSAISCWRCVKSCLTLGCAETNDTLLVMSGVRIICVTSSPLTKTFCSGSAGTNSNLKSCNKFFKASSSSNEIFAFNAA